MATPTPISVSNVSLPNTADSGSVSITIPTGANACAIGGTYYVADSSVPTSATGSAFAATTNGALRVNNPSSGAYMGAFSVAFKVTATGSQTIRVQKSGGYSEGPTCQIRWYTVDDPDNFVPSGGFLVAQPTAVPQALSLTVNSNTGDLVAGFFGTDGSSADPTAPTGTTQDGSMQTTQFDKQIAFGVNTVGASTTTVTAGSRDYPSLILMSLRGSSGGGITGTLAATESGSDTASIAGVVKVQGSLSVSETGNDTSAIAGTVLVAGSLAAAETGSDTVAIVGGSVATGSINATETGSDTASATGVVLVQGSLSVAETGSDTANVSGAVLVAGSLAASETGADAAAISGVALVQGAMSVSETGDDTFSATGSLSGGINGGLNAQESGADTFAASGVVVISGSIAVSESGTDTATLSGVVVVQGSLVVTEAGPDTFNAQGSASIRIGAMDAVESGSDTAEILGDGISPETGSPHGFVITDTAPKLWWQRKPKALDEEEAEQKVAQVVRVVERIALSQVEAEQPAPAKAQKREVREAIAPLVAEMPGFDWMTLYRTILIELGRRQQEQQAAELAQIEIARIQAMRRDEDDVLILLMSL